MVRIKKKEKATVFKSVTGSHLEFNIFTKGRTLKVSIFNSLYSSKHTKYIILVILIICGLLSFVLDILNKQFTILIVILIFLDLYRLCSTITEENLVNVRGLGFQVTTKCVLGVKTTFIPEDQVQNIFINEVIFRNKVIYVLSLLTKDAQQQEKLVALFSGTLPRLACLKIIYKHIKAIE